MARQLKPPCPPYDLTVIISRSISARAIPAKDIYHNEVKTALIKDGWTIVADPYKIRYKDAELLADLAAEKPIAAVEGVGWALPRTSSNSGNKFKLAMPTTDISVGKATLREQQRRQLKPPCPPYIIFVLE